PERYSLSRPSQQSVRDSIATSFPLASRFGPSHFLGNALINFHRTTGCLASSNNTMTPFFRFATPWLTESSHSCSSFDAVMPRLSVISPIFDRPGSFRTVEGSPPSRYSITSISTRRPVHSENPASAIPSISTRKLKFLYGSLRTEFATVIPPHGWL